MTVRVAIVVAIVTACDAPSPSPPPAPPPLLRDPWVVPPAPSELMITLERTGCLEHCPVYKLTIYRDGRVEYRGLSFVKQRGSAVAYLERRQLDELDDAFRRAQYFDLDANYTHEAGSFTTITSYRLQGRTKTIWHDSNDPHAPRALSDAESWIDFTVDIERWIGTPDERASYTY